MNKPFLILLSLLLPPTLGAGQGVSLPEETVKPFLERNCFRCHGPEKQKGKMRLDTLSLSITNNEAAESWQQVLDALNAGEMPPEDEAQPDPAAKADFLEALATAVDVVTKKQIVGLRREPPVFK